MFHKQQHSDGFALQFTKGEHRECNLSIINADKSRSILEKNLQENLVSSRRNEQLAKDLEYRCRSSTGRELHQRMQYQKR